MALEQVEQAGFLKDTDQEGIVLNGDVSSLEAYKKRKAIDSKVVKQSETLDHLNNRLDYVEDVLNNVMDLLKEIKNKTV